MARLNWGSDGKLWGAESLFWGEIDDTSSGGAVPPVWFHALISVEGILQRRADGTTIGDPPQTETVRLWTGYGDLIFTEQGEATPNTWTGGGRTLEVGGLHSSTAGTGDNRLTLAFNSLGQEFRNDFLVAVGPLKATVRAIASEDYGISWTILPVIKRGVLSAPTYSEGIYRVQVMHPWEDKNIAHRQRWSNEDQQERHAGDRGLSFMRLLAGGGIRTKWPYL